jgi:hypothetical protein
MSVLFGIPLTAIGIQNENPSMIFLHGYDYPETQRRAMQVVAMTSSYRLYSVSLHSPASVTPSSHNIQVHSLHTRIVL